MKKINEKWEWHTVVIPNDSDTDEFLEFLGEEVMLKECFKEAVNELFEELYLEIEHGDKEHRDWLKNKMDSFIKGV